MKYSTEQNQVHLEWYHLADMEVGGICHPTQGVSSLGRTTRDYPTQTQVVPFQTTEIKNVKKRRLKTINVSIGKIPYKINIKLISYIFM